MAYPYSIHSLSILMTYCSHTLKYGYSMATLWHQYGYTMAKLWQSYGKYEGLLKELCIFAAVVATSSAVFLSIKPSQTENFCYFCRLKTTRHNRIMTKKEETLKAKEMKTLYLELISIMLKRAGLKKEDIYRTAIKSWASKNLDLLTPTEMKKYQAVIMP